MKIALQTVRYVILFFIFSIIAWFLVHVLAIFGVFLLVGYVIWFLLFPKKRFLIVKPKKMWQSLIANFAIILTVSAACVGIVLLESRVLSRFGFPASPKTVSFVIPTKSQHVIGEIFSMKIEIKGVETPVNAAQADIGFDPDKLSVVDLKTEGSFATIILQKEINNNGGWVRLTGGLPNPGFSEDNGVFGTIYFQAKSPGLAEVKFLPSSMVLANDGSGSNVLKDFALTSYLITPDELSPSQMEEQKKILNISPVLGADTQKESVQLSFVNEAPKADIVSNRIDNKVQDTQPSATTNRFWNAIQLYDSFIAKLGVSLLGGDLF